MFEEQLKALKAERDQRVKEAVLQINTEYDARITDLTKKQARLTARRRKQNVTHVTLKHLAAIEKSIQEGPIPHMISGVGVFEIHTKLEKTEIPNLGACEYGLEFVALDNGEAFIFPVAYTDNVKTGKLQTWEMNDALDIVEHYLVKEEMRKLASLCLEGITVLRNKISQKGMPPLTWTERKAFGAQYAKHAAHGKPSRLIEA